VTLFDHNTLDSKLKFLDKYISLIIDHH